jgi:hypothetical protein
VAFAAIILCVASQRVLIFVRIYFVFVSVWKLWIHLRVQDLKFSHWLNAMHSYRTISCVSMEQSSDVSETVTAKKNSLLPSATSQINNGRETSVNVALCLELNSGGPNHSLVAILTELSRLPYS